MCQILCKISSFRDARTGALMCVRASVCASQNTDEHDKKQYASDHTTLGGSIKTWLRTFSDSRLVLLLLLLHNVQRVRLSNTKLSRVAVMTDIIADRCAKRQCMNVEEFSRRQIVMTRALTVWRYGHRKHWHCREYIVRIFRCKMPKIICSKFISKYNGCVTCGNLMD